MCSSLSSNAQILVGKTHSDSIPAVHQTIAEKASLFCAVIKDPQSIWILHKISVERSDIHRRDTTVSCCSTKWPPKCCSWGGETPGAAWRGQRVWGISAPLVNTCLPLDPVHFPLFYLNWQAIVITVILTFWNPCPIWVGVPSRWNCKSKWKGAKFPPPQINM